jgi:HTH-type transcriptional regulator, sugar sensing transcriptional regulator
MLEKELEKYGLNDKEAKVYLGLLELGEGSIQDIGKKSGVGRTTVYYIIEGLKQRGLVSEIKKKSKTVFFAEDPRKLEEELDEKKDNLKKIIPELLSITNILDKKPKIRYFEGEEGIKEVYKDTLNFPDRETLAWASQDYSKYFDSSFLWNEYLPKRIKKRIWQRTIAPDTKEVRSFADQDEKHLRKTKLVSPEKFPFDVEINLYAGSRIGVMSFRDKIGMIIESEGIYKTLKSIFELSWEFLPEKKYNTSDKSQVGSKQAEKENEEF